MVLRQFEAFLDDLTIITIHIPTRFVNTPLSFTVCQTNTLETIEHTVETTYTLDDLTIYRLQLHEPITFDQFYTIYDNDRNQTPVQFRNIVRTQAFDTFYAVNYVPFGANFTPTHTTFTLWAPISTHVILMLNDTTSITLTRGDKGVWQTVVSGNLEGFHYYYIHQVNGKWVQFTDPYAISSTSNGTASYVIDTAKLQKVTRVSQPVTPTQAVIYELSVRDFTSDPSANFQHPKQFLGLSEETGIHYLQQLGITHVQLMPIFDFGSIDENNPELTYNWGYDPMQYNVPEGSYTTQPNDPYKRLLELQHAINTYHQQGISVVMDVVYNHVYDIDAFSMEKIVPGYCYRVDLNNEKTNGTWCGNDIASERFMIRHFIIQSLVHWLTVIGVDGFRFDLMGILDSHTMAIISEKLRTLYPHTLLYGEGWRMDTGLDSTQLAHHDNAHHLQTIGFFNDTYRNTIKNLLHQPHELQHYDNRQKLENLLAGSIGIHHDNHQFALASQSVNYLECHDNMTLYDYLIANGLNDEQAQQKATLGIVLLLISRGMTFLHSGQEFFRTKNGIDNTYNAGDTINQFDWKRRLQFDHTIKWLQPLITLRRTHPAFLANTPEKIRGTTQFYWESQTVLKMILHSESTQLIIYINFSNNTYTLQQQLNTIVFPTNTTTATLLSPNSILISEVTI